MKLVKFLPFLLIALVIDGFQFLISLALSVIAAFPGTVGGCAVGGYFLGKMGCYVLGLVGTFPIINGALATVTEPVGIVLGFVISICISFTVGSILVLFLYMAGVLDKKAAALAYMGEVLPGLNMLPAWTALVVRCAMNEARNKVVGTTILNTMIGFGGALVLPNTKVGDAMRAGTLLGSGGLAREMPQEELEELRTAPQQRVPMQDMRLRRTVPAAANDNFKTSNTPYAKAA